MDECVERRKVVHVEAKEVVSWLLIVSPFSGIVLFGSIRVPFHEIGLRPTASMPTDFGDSRIQYDLAKYVQIEALATLPLE